MFQRRANSGARAPAETAAPRLTLAAFGKHPGWDDHIPGIGVETEALAYVKQALYVGGIGGQIDSGAWEKLDPGKRLTGFVHAFLWLRAGHVIIGHLWSSTDRKGRTKYPMVLCLDGEGVTPGFMLTKARLELEQLRDTCQKTTSADQVAAECGVAQERVRALLSGFEQTPPGTTLPGETRRSFLERPELGPDRLGFLRLLHELGSALGAPVGGRGLGTRALADLRSCHLRLPLASNSRSEALLLWSAFLRCAIPDAVPLLVISRGGENWVDVTIGEPASGDFFCLQASPKALPLATEIPYELSPELKPRLLELEARFLGAELSPSAPGGASLSKSAAPVSATGVGEINAPRRKRNFGLFLGAGAAVLIVIVGVWFFSGGRSPTPSVESTPVEPSPSPAKAGTVAEVGAKADAEAKARLEASLKAEAEAKRIAEEKRLADEKARAGANAKALEEVRLKAEAEAKRIAEEKRLANEKAKAAADAKAREEARLKAEAEAKRIAEEKRIAEVKAQEQRDHQSAQSCFDQGDYDGASKLCAAHPGVESFDNLAKTNSFEQTALNDARQKFAAADYSFVESLKSQRYIAKPPFAALVNQAADEQRILGELESWKQTTNWMAVQNKLAGPASAGFASKKPFDELRKWAASSAAEDKKKLDTVKSEEEYEILLVWFRVLKPTDPLIQSPGARAAKAIDGNITLDFKDQCLASVDRLRKQFGDRGLLNQKERGNNLGKLKREITSR